MIPTAGQVEERRAHRRQTIPLTVLLSYGDREPIALETLDVSDGGLFIKIDDGERPATGCAVTLQVVGLPNGLQPPSVSAVVVRESELGIAIRFTDPAMSE